MSAVGKTSRSSSRVPKDATFPSSLHFVDLSHAPQGSMITTLPLGLFIMFGRTTRSIVC